MKNLDPWHGRRIIALYVDVIIVQALYGVQLLYRDCKDGKLLLKGSGIILQGLYLCRPPSSRPPYSNDGSQTTDYCHCSRKRSSLSIGGLRRGRNVVLDVIMGRLTAATPQSNQAIDNGHIENAPGSEITGSSCRGEALGGLLRCGQALWLSVGGPLRCVM
ncbi:hypothetical protein BKA70DRAFT_1225322 [Coprinopsis sp. MPI-PUGE-AT-0042]|nr:hypothetical protein BKA70DRAFT_1225322 [Coprinopsis sp. MPI-PUGE-AT-0042]